ncbi:DUF664 domain-containing protein [Nocardia bhagyanarayanae]|uniref:mycothiol transferase n=1 Tax=Nocardia bhagyanarayanae TaxID=1215925 RepID=UPI00114F474D|nr:DUF664 domain-containing protein [Nocardia bhagyanarayanae]
MLPGESLARVLAEYEKVAAETDQPLRELPDLNVSNPLPDAPRFEPGARRTLLHIAAETVQYAGHPDIIRESLDGAKSRVEWKLTAPRWVSDTSGNRRRLRPVVPGTVPTPMW